MNEKIIEKIFKSFERFIYRDFFYIVSGLIIIFTTIFFFYEIQNIIPFRILYLFNISNTIFYILFIAVSYIIGYISQEFFSIIHVVSTTYRKPWCYMRFITRLFIGGQNEKYKYICLPKKKKEIPKQINMENLYYCFDTHVPPNIKQRVDRMLNLMQIGSSVGSAFLMSSIIIIINFFIHNNCDLWQILIVYLIIALLLLHVNWIKNLQFYYLKLYLNCVCTKCKGNALILDKKKRRKRNISTREKIFLLLAIVGTLIGLISFCIKCF